MFNSLDTAWKHSNAGGGSVYIQVQDIVYSSGSVWLWCAKKWLLQKGGMAQTRILGWGWQPYPESQVLPSSFEEMDIPPLCVLTEPLGNARGFEGICSLQREPVPCSLPYTKIPQAALLLQKRATQLHKVCRFLLGRSKYHKHSQSSPFENV